MNTMNAGYLVIVGIFVILLGAVGFVTHPEKAYTSLMFGGGFGALFVLWGILGAKGLRWSKTAALLTASVLSAACAWRASLGWLALANGQSEKVFASLLITLTLAVSMIMLVMLLKERKASGAEKPMERRK
jgi:hypothetical protein